jgi:hypothetical protein
VLYIYIVRAAVTPIIKHKINFQLLLRFMVLLATSFHKNLARYNSVTGQLVYLGL